MWVFIDTHEAGVIRAGLISPTRRDVQTRKGRSSALFPFLAKVFPQKTLQSAEGICVVAGPGSFSAVRSGVLAANLLARIFGKPLVGVSVGEELDVTAAVPFVAPIYDAEPNITRPRPVGNIKNQ